MGFRVTEYDRITGAQRVRSECPDLLPGTQVISTAMRWNLDPALCFRDTDATSRGEAAEGVTYLDTEAPPHDAECGEEATGEADEFEDEEEELEAPSDVESEDASEEEEVELSDSPE